MKKLLFITLFQFIFGYVFAQTPFITTWKTDNPGGSANNQITIPTTGTGYNYSVAWEKVDDVTVTGTGGPFTGNATLTFPQVGTYRVSISGDFPQLFFLQASDPEKLLTVEQWGTNPWRSMASAFYACTRLTIPALDTPNLSNVTDMSTMFFRANSFNQGISNWNVSNVTNMASMFQAAISFNQNLSNWDVSSVTDMSFMFTAALQFNQDIRSWNVSNVTSMTSMFTAALQFNQGIGNWDVSNVTSMADMFGLATSFDQNLGTWDVSNVTDMTNMLLSSALSISNYDSTLIGWASLPSLQNNVPFGAGGLSYCNGEAARDSLINLYNWTITDAGRLCPTALARVDSKAVGIKKQEERLTDITIYPNPAKDQFITVFPQALEAPTHWVLTDPMGKEVATGSLEEGTTSQVTPTHALAPGAYFYRLMAGGSVVKTKRIIVAR